MYVNTGSVDTFEKRKRMCRPTFIWITKYHLLTKGATEHMPSENNSAYRHNSPFHSHYNVLQIQPISLVLRHHGWCKTSPLLLFDMAHHALSLYHWADEISSRKLCNRVFHLSDAEHSPIMEKELSDGWVEGRLRKTTSKNGSGQVGGKTHTETFIEATTTPSITMITSCRAWLSGDRIFSKS